MSNTAQTDWWNQKSRYHTDRAPHSHSHVQSVLLPQLVRYVPKPARLRVADHACGGGSVAAEFVQQATSAGFTIEKFTLMDVVQDNLDVARMTVKKVLPDAKIARYLVNGSDFEGFKGPKANFLYCWDAMVHFDIIDVAGYIRTLGSVVDGVAFFHHSNLDRITHDIRHNPHHRNFMTQNAFQQMCVSSGHTVLEQRLIDWGDQPGLDCFTTVRVQGSA